MGSGGELRTDGVIRRCDGTSEKRVAPVGRRHLFGCRPNLTPRCFRRGRRSFFSARAHARVFYSKECWSAGLPRSRRSCPVKNVGRKTTDPLRHRRRSARALSLKEIRVCYPSGLRALAVDARNGHGRPCNWSEKRPMRLLRICAPP